jgi:transcriptional regulator with XRE-family HTH domain
MTLGGRIEERLKALDLSQAELARRARVPQTTMNGLIRGNSRTTPHLIRIAQALETTAAYLMGETDDPKAEFSEMVLSTDEQELIRIYREIQDTDQQIVRFTAHRFFQLRVREKIEEADNPDEFEDITVLQCVYDDPSSTS